MPLCQSQDMEAYLTFPKLWDDNLINNNNKPKKQNNSDNKMF